MTQTSVRTFAEQVTAARRARGWTQAQLAERLRISQPRVSAIEAGDPPSLALAVRCSAVLSIEYRDLLAQYREEELSATADSDAA